MSTAVTASRRIAGPIDRHVASLEARSETLGAVRDTLLPKLLSGEIRVRDAEELAGQVG